MTLDDPYAECIAEASTAPSAGPMYRLQPIVDLLDDHIVAYELLAGKAVCPEWRMPEWRNWYAVLGRIIPKVLETLSASTVVYVNLDADQVLDDVIREHVWGFVSPRCGLEWTERFCSPEQYHEAIRLFLDFKASGVPLAVDDLGSVGMDGLARVHAVNPDLCKIDWSFFRTHADRGPESLVGLCRHLSRTGAGVVIEGIETDQDMRMAIAAGARYGQGFHFPGLLRSHAGATECDPQGPED